MGSGLGWALREGGHDVVTSLAGRSLRTARLAKQAGLRIAARPVDVVAQADVIMVVTPPGAAVDAATEIAAMATAPGVAERLTRAARCVPTELAEAVCKRTRAGTCPVTTRRTGLDHRPFASGWCWYEPVEVRLTGRSVWAHVGRLAGYHSDRGGAKSHVSPK
jgi:hypothetical protein